MGGCQNYGPFLGCRTILGTQKGTLILTTIYTGLGFRGLANRGLGCFGVQGLWESTCQSPAQVVVHGNPERPQSQTPAVLG